MLLNSPVKTTIFLAAFFLASCGDNSSDSAGDDTGANASGAIENSANGSDNNSIVGANQDEDTPDVIQEDEATLAYKAENEEWLASFKEKQGVETGEGGLAYRIIEKGDGAAPTEDSVVDVRYIGRLIDGTEFDRSEGDETVTFPVSGLIEGWTKALLLMKVGDKMELALPHELAYGNTGRPGIPAYSTLVFEMELVNVKTKEEQIAEFEAPNLAYLEQYKDQDGVIVTDSGLMYKVLEDAPETAQSPGGDAVITAHYAGSLVDGTEFDSSFKRGEPLTFPINRVIPAWQEAMQLMKVGQTIELVVPQELGYGSRGAGQVIPPYSTLIFKIELVSFDSPADQQKFLDDNASKQGVQVTESGLQYKIIEEGTGEKPIKTSRVRVHYRGRLIDGTEFDSSYNRGEPAVFPVSAVIAGWTEGLQLMKEGAKYEFYIPQQLGYGDRGTGNIPPYSTLIFDVELLEVMN